MNAWFKEMLVPLILLAALVGIGALGGGTYVGARKDAEIAKLEKGFALEKKKAADDFAAKTEKNRKALADEVTRGNQLAATLVADKTRFEEERRTLERRIKYVTAQYQSAPGAVLQPIPACVFTVGWVRDYNAAIGAQLPGGDQVAPGTGAGQASVGPETVDTGLLLDSGVTPADILAHAIDYGAECRGYAAQANRLIDKWDGRP